MQYEQLALEIVRHRNRIGHGPCRSLVECSGKKQRFWGIGGVVEPGNWAVRTYRQDGA